MVVDVFKALELEAIANLARIVEKFNREQVGEAALHAEVLFFREGDEVAQLSDALTFDGTASRGELRLEVKAR